MKDSERLALIGFVVLSEVTGAISALFTAPAISTWYAALLKPVLTPPGWVFAPVWTILYALMGYAAWRIWKHGPEHARVKVALIVFFEQLALNLLWSVIFFGLHALTAALIEIAILLVVIIAMVARFESIERKAAQLLLPYLAWVMFAMYLTYGLWVLNA